ncbi:MAG: DUF3237 family protein [Burkholderiales bacterium]|jgi:hypothetical protein|nr:DUF3237 family protein [Burkholderiales bacterium]
MTYSFRGNWIAFCVTVILAPMVQAAPTLEAIGTFKMDLYESAAVDNQAITGKFGGGELVFANGGAATIETCVEDGYIKSSGIIDFNLRCFAKLDDGAALLIRYTGLIKTGEGFWDHFLAGEVTGPGRLMEFWCNEMKMVTTSEKYAWVNETMFIGEGANLSVPTADGPGIVHYELYALRH